MGRWKNTKKKIEAFVSTLSPQECRRELVLAYLQMERCIRLLDGTDTEPVEMRDNGLSSDLELFYRCKKVREEKDYLDEKRNTKYHVYVIKEEE